MWVRVLIVRLIIPAALCIAIGVTTWGFVDNYGKPAKNPYQDPLYERAFKWTAYHFLTFVRDHGSSK